MKAPSPAVISQGGYLLLLCVLEECCLLNLTNVKLPVSRSLYAFPLSVRKENNTLN